MTAKDIMTKDIITVSPTSTHLIGPTKVSISLPITRTGCVACAALSLLMVRDMSMPASMSVSQSSRLRPATKRHEQATRAI